MLMSGIVLAGGQSSRMGVDKALLPFEGTTLLESLCRKIQPFFEQVYVIVEDSHKTEFLDLAGAIVYQDVFPKAGPLAGLYTGLCESSCVLNMAFSVDMPFVDEACILKLMQASREKTAEAYYFETLDGKAQPFPGIYTRESRSGMRRLIEQNVKSMQRFLEEVPAEKIIFDDFESPVFKNLNHRQDYYDALLLSNIYF